MKTRTVIIDDEPLARGRIKQLLHGHPEIEVVGEAGDGVDALRVVLDVKPDLVFLDIQMPELDGLDVARHLAEQGANPVILFVTAYDQYAVKAFEVNAVDYLLKPFDRERFEAALGRAVEHVAHRRTRGLEQRMANLLDELRPTPKHADRIAIKLPNRVVLVKSSDIDWVEAADNYVKLHVGKEVFMHRETMSGLEGTLDPARFVRISRSTMVHVDRIKELQPLFHGEYVVLLRDGTQLTLSRGYREKLQVLLGKSGIP